MWTLLTVVFWLGVAAGLLALLGMAAGRFLQIDPQPDAVHFVTTSDGWRLGLSRYRPQIPLAGAPPVLLCPGLALSGRVFDLGPDRSLARYLARYGYDTWILDWRGRGESERPRVGGSRRYTWCFDDYLSFDLPAALEALRRDGGQAPAHAIGFGLGGLALLCAAGARTIPPLASISTVGTTAFFRRTALELPSWALRTLGRLRLEAVVRLSAPLLGRSFPGPLDALQNRDSVEPAFYRRALVNGIASPSAREIGQLDDWLRRDHCAGLAEERDYRGLFSQVSTPVLLIAGVRDRVAPPEAVEQTAGALDGAERQLVQASRLHGMASNYGHLDLLIGANVPRDIYPHLLRWLDLHSGVKLPDGRPEPPRGEVGIPDVIHATALAAAPEAPLQHLTDSAADQDEASGLPDLNSL